LIYVKNASPICKPTFISQRSWRHLMRTWRLSKKLTAKERKAFAMSANHEFELA